MPRRSVRISRKRKVEEKNIASPNRFSPLSNENPTNIATEEKNNCPQTPNKIDEIPVSRIAEKLRSGTTSSIIVNLSKKDLTTSEKSVLEKGLNFGITKKTINKESLFDDVYKFQLKLN